MHTRFSVVDLCWMLHYIPPCIIFSMFLWIELVSFNCGCNVKSCPLDIISGRLRNHVGNGYMCFLHFVSAFHVYAYFLVTYIFCNPINF